MEETEVDNESAMLTCCLCRSALRDPILLRCLHHACRPCVDKVVADAASGSAASDASASAVAAAANPATAVKCFLCFDESAASIAFDNHFLAAVIRAREAERNSGDGDVSLVTCSLCTDVRRPADVICPACPATLCVECSTWHARLKKGHVAVRIATSGLRRALIVAAIAASPPPDCRNHGKRAQFACAACPTPAACADCARSCVALGHEPLMRALSGQIAERSAAVARLALSAAAAELRLRLERCAVAAAAERCGRERSAAARDSALDALNRRRRALLDAADIARERARRRLATRGLGSASRAEVGANEDRVEAAAAALAPSLPLSERMLHAARYGETLLALPQQLPPPVGVWRVLSQRRRLAVRIDELEAEDRARSTAVAAAGADAAVRIAIASPERVGAAVECILGAATSKTGDVAPDGRNDMQLPVQKWQRPPLANSPGSLLPNALATKTARFDASTLQTFSLAEKCYDVTVSADGTILAACGRAGLVEYDVSSGLQVGAAWRAALDEGHDLVSCADALDDGRIAVGLIISGCVVLLSRRLDGGRRQRMTTHDVSTGQSTIETATMMTTMPASAQESAGDDGTSSSWREQETRIAWYQAAPMSLRAHGDDRLAVASGRLEKGGWSDGPLLTLIALRRGSGGDSRDGHAERLLFSKRLDYSIKRVAATATVVVTTYQRGALVPRLLQEHGIDCFDTGGNLLWRRSISEPALGLCAVPAATDAYDAAVRASPGSAPAQLYVSLPSSGRVALMNVDDGKIIADRVFDVAAELRRRGGISGSTPKLCNLSLPQARASGEAAEGDSRNLLMAALCSDNQTVACMRVILAAAATSSHT